MDIRKIYYLSVWMIAKTKTKARMQDYRKYTIPTDIRGKVFPRDLCGKVFPTDLCGKVSSTDLGKSLPQIRV